MNSLDSEILACIKPGKRREFADNLMADIAEMHLTKLQFQNQIIRLDNQMERCMQAVQELKKLSEEPEQVGELQTSWGKIQTQSAEQPTVLECIRLSLPLLADKFSSADARAAAIRQYPGNMDKISTGVYYALKQLCEVNILRKDEQGFYHKKS